MNEIIRKTIKIEGKKKVKLPFKKEDTDKIIYEEVLKLKLDAVRALYNACTKNPKYLTPERIKKIQKCLPLADGEFREILNKFLEVVEFSNKIDYKSLFNQFIDQLHRKDYRSVDYNLRFISSQSRDEEKCKELFNEKVILKLLEIFEHTDNQKFIEIINNYVMHENSEPLSQQVWKKMISLINEETINYIVLILTSAVDKKIKYETSQKDLELLSNHLDNEDCVVVDNGNIEFRKIDTECSDTAVSRLVSKIILNSINQECDINEQTMENIISAVESSRDKQTKISCAKCVYNLNKYKMAPFLERIYDLIQVPVFDVSVYMQSVYCRSSANENHVTNAQILNLSSLFQTEDLKLGDINFKEEINENIISTFEKAAEKQAFDDECFNLFEMILYYNESYMHKVIRILLIYTKTKTIPSSTVAALENALGFNEHRQIALETLENVIQMGKPVGEKTLKILIDDLYMSKGDSGGYLEVLERARRNQELSDNLFYMLELLKASKGLESAGNKKSFLNFIKILIRQKILHLPKELMETLVCLLKNGEHDFEVIEIFQNAANNQQKLPDSVFEEMKNKIEKKELEEKILSLYAEVKPEMLPENGFIKLIARIKDDIVSSKKYLYSILSFLERNKKSIKKYNYELASIVEKGLSFKDLHIQETCLRLLVFGVKLENSNPKLLKRILCQTNCTNEMKSLIQKLRDGNTVSVQATRNIVDLEFESNKQYLNEVYENFKNNGDLNENNLNRLKKIIDEEIEEELLLKAIDISKITFDEKKDLPDYLIDSIALLMDRKKFSILIQF